MSRARSTTSLSAISRDLAAACDQLKFAAPVTHVYDPLVYARVPHEAYLERFGRGPKEVLFLGMNPGPFGMAQTGIPFGDVGMVRDWLGIHAFVGKPPREHDKRKVLGFDCPRGEVSGTRLWGWARARFVTPDAFFARFFVLNYCPLLFLEQSGANRTPDKLAPAEREKLTAACDEALRRYVGVLEPRTIIGIGTYAEARARRALGEDTPIKIATMLHPSPASPKANTGWVTHAEKDLRDAGVRI